MYIWYELIIKNHIKKQKVVRRLYVLNFCMHSILLYATKHQMEKFENKNEMHWYERLLMKVIDSGEIPEHIAIIMDGNRRYARKMMFDSVAQGHQLGAEKLRQIIEWLSILHGVKMLTVYAFSLLNFNRVEDEVTALMDLAEKTFSDMADTPDFFHKNNCKVQFIGRIEMLEERVLKQIRRVESVAPENPEFILNICVCYTAHDEIERARDKCLSENVKPTYNEVFNRLDLPCKPDLLIRTSGVNRMSNFLLMQCSDTPIVITDILWPELTVLEMAKILLKYQLRNYLP
ncbi:undecaprenyl diphosphate synthase family protein [Tritrichomonas foetus]|uniref:Alkyl transferase n=1 Tax=Tritrichomonas foetus TaxID=1144522 RepID=A0A1J4KKQ5_9EUKA|nr:undecaprenyl diphosphate synthase family protein [Tritrichomonas foetus]|eukprot:OHT11879.1 undecaprenyl diphosphate synthase family protein [Tritrichomonas foetus]